MTNFSRRLDALEEAQAPFVPRVCHLVGRVVGHSEREAIAAYEAGNAKAVQPDDLVIFLRGVVPQHG